MLKFKMRGQGEMATRVLNISRSSPKRFADGLYEEAKIEAKESERKTPVLSGALAATVRAEEPVLKGRSISCAIAAGDDEVDYAVHVHEDLDAYHDNGEAKFIESTLRESAPFMLERIARRIRLKPGM